MNPKNIIRKQTYRTLGLIISQLIFIQGALCMPAIIPQPAVIEIGEGSRSISLSDLTLRAPEEYHPVLALFSKQVASLVGKTPRLVENDATIEVVNDPKSAFPDRESYALEIQPKRITLSAGNAAGVLYGTQSLLQLIAAAVQADSQTINLPCLLIKDRPRFQWRGFMLDCSRTFLSPEYLKQTIDRMAHLKLNTLHLHLTDDQGWRLPSERFPRLETVASRWDSAWPEEKSGFYTREQIQELVEYAQLRNITIVPEIEMPAHALALITAYPELACQSKEYRIVPYMEAVNWKPEMGSYHYAVLCPGKEKTFEMVEQILDEVIQLFPGEFIHIGGDECPKVYWEQCPDCQQRMKENQLATPQELQSYFIRRVEKMISSRGRRMVGWSEIAEGGLAEGAVLMAWLKTEDGWEAVKKGNTTVFVPTSHLYFDYPHETTPLSKTYSYDPVAPELSSAEVNRILGLQACMWTHIARTPEAIDEWILPRFVALGEIAWSPAEAREWKAFRQRLLIQHEPFQKVGLWLPKDIPEN